MTREEYIKRLREQLNYYKGNHDEIISNYEMIIDELIDEGLTMQDVISKLGRPGALSEEIAEEFGLTYTEQTIQKTSMPSWAKTMLIVVALIAIIPTILSLVMGFVGTLFRIMISIVFLLFGGIFTTGSLWSSPLSSGFKLLATGTSIMGVISILIITYFVLYIGVKILRLLVNTVRETKAGGINNEK